MMADDLNENLNEETILESENGAAAGGSGDMAAEAPPADTAAEVDEAPPTLEEQLTAAQTEAEDFKDRWLRSQAEFANARKRMEKQRVETYANATADVMRKLLPVLDDFDRAMESMPSELQEHSWSEGIALVNKKLATMLEGFQVKPIEAVGAPFDPNLHEAISQEDSDEYESGVVIRELQKGYVLGERVIRPSLVIVAA